MSAVNVSPFFCARDSVILITLSRSCTRLYSTEYISNLPDSILLISSIGVNKVIDCIQIDIHMREIQYHYLMVNIIIIND